MNEIDAQLALGVELFNRGEFFEAHEAMEDAMNLLDDDTATGISISGCCARRSQITSSATANCRALDCICAPH